MSAQGLAIFFECVTIELFPIINSQFSGDCKSADYVLPEELLNVGALMFASGFASTHFVK
jgi:hypothetical protein